jgi:predicted RNase H-like HicB family nuclease
MNLYSIRLSLELNANGVYTVTSPDVPGLVSEGSTPEEITHNVQDAIRVMIEVFDREGWLLPPALLPENALRPKNTSRVLVAA